MKFEYLDHTADVKFRAYGDSVENAFGNAALAMYNVMVDTSKVMEKISKKISAEGHDVQALLYNFLEQFLILLDSENYFLSSVKKLRITGNDRDGYVLEAETMGDDAAKYETIGPQVKAATYNDMIVKSGKGNCMVQVVVDI